VPDEPLLIEVDHERTTTWLIGTGWLDPADIDDLDAIGAAVSAALAAWSGDLDRDPSTLPVKNKQTESTP
jgi:hypothetical protein